MSTLGSAALQYAGEYGWPVFPCKPRGKAPATGHGFKDATTDLGKIKQWWSQGAYNIGMPTDGLVVIDIDGEQGYATWAELSNELNLNEMTVTVLTGGGGKHLWYSLPEGAEIKCGTGVLGPGIDVRTNGGYVVVPPSETEAKYEWVMAPDMVDIAPLPPELNTRLTPEPRQLRPVLEIPQGRSRQMYWFNRALSKITDDGMGRNEAGLWLSTQLRDDGLTIEQAIPILKQFCQSASGADPKDHDYEETEALASLRSAYAREAREPAPEPLSHPAAQPGNTAAVNGAFPIDLAKAHELNQFTLGDDGNSQRFALLCGGRIKFCEALGWTYWNGKHWQSQANQQATALAKRTVRTMYASAAFATSDTATKTLINHAKRTEQNSRLQAMLTLAKPEPTILSRYEIWDTDLYALNVTNGTVDLRTGELRKHNPADRITKMACVAYDSEAKSLLWDTFLHTVFDDNNHLIDFMQRLIGYSLCGHTREDRFSLLWGNGANGKTTLLNTIRSMMGTYAAHVRPETFIGGATGIPNDLAALEGRRFVTTVETDEGRKFAEGLLKQFTGGEPIQCRFLHREFFTYVPEGHLFVASNHRPVIKGTDDAIWRRVLLIPFTVTIPPENRDRMLCDRLKGEASAILNWCLEGYRKYESEGLNPPNEVLAAVKDYRAEQDLIGKFLDECCETGDEHVIKCSDLRNRYNTWCLENGEKPMTSQMFGRRIAEQGFNKVRIGRAKVYHYTGLAILTEQANMF